VNRLLKVLHAIVDDGATMVVIEHNLDVIKNADHIIDLGPEGGDAGGYIVALGTPEEIAQVEESFTGQYLKNALK
jgi:excinuclease ABC subunit A